MIETEMPGTIPHTEAENELAREWRAEVRVNLAGINTKLEGMVKRADLDSVVDRLGIVEGRINLVEKWQAYAIGAAAVVGAIVSFVSQWLLSIIRGK